MVSFSDRQIKIIRDAAKAVPFEKRGIYLERIVALMRFRPLTDQDVLDVVALAQAGLIVRRRIDAA
jgi:hypothetical protein